MYEQGYSYFSIINKPVEKIRASVQQQKNGWLSQGVLIQWIITQPLETRFLTTKNEEGKCAQLNGMFKGQSCSSAIGNPLRIPQ